MLYMFGSRAKGSHNSYSDLDLLCDENTTKEELDIIRKYEMIDAYTIEENNLRAVKGLNCGFGKHYYASSENPLKDKKPISLAQVIEICEANEDAYNTHYNLKYPHLDNINKHVKNSPHRR